MLLLLLRIYKFLQTFFCIIATRYLTLQNTSIYAKL